MNHFVAILLILGSAALHGCGKAVNGSTGTGSTTATGTATDAPDSSGTASTTGSATSTVVSTSTVTVTETRHSTVTHTEPTTVTATQTVATTVTATQTVPTTVTATFTQSSTVTLTNTLTNTVTNTVTSTLTSTVTATSTAVSLVQGNYQSDTCYLDRLASDQAKQSVYVRTTFQFTNGAGHKKVSQYADSDCEKAAVRANLKFTYSYAGSRGGLFVFRIDQESEEKSGTSQRYWLVAIEQDGAFRFALDGEHGQGPYLSEPEGQELGAAYDQLGKYGVWFR